MKFEENCFYIVRLRHHTINVVGVSGGCVDELGVGGKAAAVAQRMMNEWHAELMSLRHSLLDEQCQREMCCCNQNSA